MQMRIIVNTIRGKRLSGKCPGCVPLARGRIWGGTGAWNEMLGALHHRGVEGPLAYCRRRRSMRARSGGSRRAVGESTTGNHVEACNALSSLRTTIALSSHWTIALRKRAVISSCKLFPFRLTNSTASPCRSENCEPFSRPITSRAVASASACIVER